MSIEPQQPGVIAGPQGALVHRQFEIRSGPRSLRAEIGVPAAPAGWVILVQPGADRQRARAVSEYFNWHGLAALSVEAGSDTGRLAEDLRAAWDWLREQPHSAGLPVNFFSIGPGAAAVLRLAAACQSIHAIVSWNGAPAWAWRPLSAVRAPALFLVDEHAPLGLRWANRLARWRLGRNSRYAAIADINLEAQALAWIARGRARAAGRPASRAWPQRAAAGAMLLALGVSLGTRSPAAAYSEPDFSEGEVLSPADVKGDGFGPRVQRPARRGAGPAMRAVRALEADFADGYTLGAGEVAGDGLGPRAGERALVDAGGMKFLVNTDIIVTTASSASGAASDAGISQTLAVTTSAGGTTLTTLSDAFDGYNGLCIGLSGALGPCGTSDPNYTIYNKNGAGTTECAGPVSGINRQVVLNIQMIGDLQVSRKIFVPDNDEFIRWLNIITNTGTLRADFTVVTANNLGSDLDTLIVASGDGDAAAETDDTWVTTFQNYDAGGASFDPRLGHVLQGPGAAVGLAGIAFTNGDDEPYWAYSLSLAPGQTAIVMNFATGQPSKAEAASKAAELAGLPANALQCMTETEKQQVVNFSLDAAGETVFLPILLRPASAGAGQIDSTLGDAVRIVFEGEP